MVEYSNDIKGQVIIYESDDYVVCHPWSLSDHIRIYNLCTYTLPISHKMKTGWLSCGTWYLRDDGKYYDSSNYYGNGLGVADTIEQIVDKIRNRNN